MRKYVYAILFLVISSTYSLALDIDADSNDAVDVTYGGTNATTAAGARTNLELGNSATLDTGTGAGTVATGDHTHTGYESSTSNDFDPDRISGDTTDDDLIDPDLLNPIAVRNDIGTVWTAAPTGADLVVGAFYWADNDTWDPASISGTDDYQVLWNGADFVPIQDINGNIFINSISESIPINDADGTGALQHSLAFSDTRTGTYPSDSDFTYVVIPSAGSLSASWAAGYGPWHSIYVHPGAFRVDGTNCKAVTSEAINSGPYIYYTECADAAGTIDFQIAMPDNWDGQAIYVEPHVFSNVAPSGSIQFNAKFQARAHDATINNTWVSTNGEIYFEDAETAGTTVDTQYDVFKSKNKTAMDLNAAGGDMLFGQIARVADAGTHTVSTAAIRVMGIKIYYQVDELDEKD